MRKGLIANFLGQGWSAVLQIIFVPITLALLGVESYGLIGFYATLQATLQILDGGLSQTMNRELARLSAQTNTTQEIRNVVRTFETGYWLLGILLGGTVVLASSFIAETWLTGSALSTSVIRQSVVLMGILTAVQWPLSFYQGCLMGLQRHVLVNGLRIAMSSLIWILTIGLLVLTGPTITAFFQFYIAGNVVYVTVMTLSVWRVLPSSATAPRITAEAFRAIRGFALGMLGITVMGALISQMDKLITSSLVSLTVFGYYALATVLSNGLNLFVLPTYNTLLPRLTAYASLHDEESLARLYHTTSRVLSAVLFPTAALLAMFSYEVPYVWTGDAALALRASDALRLLVIGTTLNGIMYLPYTLQLAHGWTSIALRLNVVLLCISVPLTYWLVTAYGITGAAAGWVAFNGLYAVLGIPLTHRRLLKNELQQWLLQDILRPLLISMLVAGACSWLIPPGGTRVMTLLYLGLAFVMTLLATTHLDKDIRRWINTHVPWWPLTSRSSS